MAVACFGGVTLDAGGFGDAVYGLFLFSCFVWVDDKQIERVLLLYYVEERGYTFLI